MSAQENVQRPRTLGIIIVCLIGGTFNTWSGGSLINQVNEFIAQGGKPHDWVLSTAYFSIVLGVLQLQSALLVSRYKRIGLYLCAFVFIVTLLTNGYVFLTRRIASPTTVGWIFLPAYVLYYVYRYLTQEPQRSFFS